MSDSQVSFSTLGTSVGHVSKSSGLVKVESIGNESRFVKEGWPVFFGETVVTNSTSSVIITFNSGEDVVIGPRSSIEVDDEFGLVESVENQQDDPTKSIDALQEAILAGADPSLIQEAPAAGEEAIEGQHRVDVAIERNNEGALPSYGYDTDSGFLNSSAPEGRLITSNNSENDIIDNSIGSVTLSIENAGADGIYNALELGADNLVSLTMTVDGSSVGDTLTYSIDDDDPIVVVLTEDDITNGIVINVPPASSVSASLSDESGNNSETVTLVVPDSDTEADAGTVTVDAITPDDVINASESTTSNILIAGSASGGDIAEGDTVTLEINGETYTTTVAEDGTWSVNVAGSDLAADTTFDAVVTSNDVAGNTIASTGSSTHTLDLRAFGQIDVDRITGDSILNAGDVADGNMVAITGYVGNDATAGDTLTVSLNGVVIGTGVVSSEQDADGKYLYSVDVLGSDLANIRTATASLIVTVSGTDAAGNSFSTQSTEIFSVDLYADVDVFVEDDNYDSVITEGEENSLVVGGFLEFSGSVSSITVTDNQGNVVTITDGIYFEDYGDYAYFEHSIDVSTLSDGELTIVVNVLDADGESGSSEPETIIKDSDHVTYLGDTDSVEVRIASIGNTQNASSGTSDDDDLRGSEVSDDVEGFAGDDVLIGNGGSDVLSGEEGNDILIGGSIMVGDAEVDTLTGGNGDDVFVLQNTLALDHITDFNAQEDKLDLTALLTGLSDNPGEGADTSVIEDFLSANIQVTDKRVTIDGDDVATFGSESNFDSNVDGAVSGFDSITVIFNDQEYSINIDG